jgi:hypothetical protein
MKNMLIITSISLLSSWLAIDCLAGPQRPRALAAVAVARAVLDVADEQPRLPDTVRANSAVAPENDSSQHSRDRVSSDAVHNNRPQDAVLPGKDAPDIPAAAVALSIPKIELSKQTPISEVLPAQLVIGGWVRGCSSCIRLERDIKSTLTPLGWSIGDRLTDQIQFVHLPPTEAVPQITLFQNGNAIHTWSTYTDPATLSYALRKAWDESPPLQQVASASGSAGTIHAQSQIRALLTWWRRHIGERVRGSISWDRTGAQTFPLLARGDWSVRALFGQSGRVEVAARGAKDLPVESLGFGYRVLGEDVSFDLDPVTMKGLALRLGPALPAMSPAPSQFDPVTAWTLITIFRDLWSLLHPTCDLQLGGNVSAVATLNDETLTIEFQQCPSIKLVALFTFQLRVTRVELTESSVRLTFGGSRLVKERTFLVR